MTAEQVLEEVLGDVARDTEQPGAARALARRATYIDRSDDRMKSRLYRATREPRCVATVTPRLGDDTCEVGPDDRGTNKARAYARGGLAWEVWKVTHCLCTGCEGLRERKARR